MSINYNNRKFRIVASGESSEISDELVFHYQQNGAILSCEYTDKNVIFGQLLGVVAADGSIDMRYQQISANHSLRTGQCRSTPEWLENGKLRLHEKWQWTDGDKAEGFTILEEITAP